MSVQARWAGAFEINTDRSGWQHFGRLDPTLFISPSTDGLEDRARMPAGVRATWTASSGRLIIEAEGSADSSPFDVLVDGRLVQRVSGAGRVRHELDLGTLRPDSTIQLWLPQFGRLRVLEASLEGHHVSAVAETGSRWLAYGSSITHCQQAEGPSETWPALVARSNGWQLHSLGFAGECQLDPAAESTIQQLPADFISLCLGINSYNAAAFSLRTYASQVMGFTANIRKVHREVPIAVITPLLSLPREKTVNAVGATLRDYRAATADVVRVLQERGDGGIHCLDGEALFSAADCERFLPDTLHPNGDGYLLLAERLGPLLAAVAGE